jgi:hypothetical protein
LKRICEGWNMGELDWIEAAKKDYARLCEKEESEHRNRTREEVTG